jgi:hypothetical protein
LVIRKLLWVDCVWLFMIVPLETRGLRSSGGLGRWHDLLGLMDTQQGVHERGTTVDGLTHVPAAVIPRPNDVLEVDALPRQLGTHGTAQKRVAMIDSHFRHIPRVVPDGDGLADVGGQRRLDIAEALKMNAIPLHPARSGDR